MKDSNHQCLARTKQGLLYFRCVGWHGLRARIAPVQASSSCTDQVVGRFRFSMPFGSPNACPTPLFFGHTDHLEEMNAA